MFDIIFISYNEPNAVGNFAKLKERFPLVKHVQGVRGIHQAHIAAAKRSFSPMFWVVDADAIILDSFNFNYSLTKEEQDIVHVWHSRNPINDLEYGYGGVKLLPKKLTLALDVTTPDMTTSISSKFKAMNEVSNITAFNTDAFTTWRSAFRECVKLSSKIIDGQLDAETTERLKIWCSIGRDRLYGEDAIDGANYGRKYGQENAGNLPALSLINDFEWLKFMYSQTH